MKLKPVVLLRYIGIYTASAILLFIIIYLVAPYLFLDWNDNEFGRAGQMLLIGYCGFWVSLALALPVTLWIRRKLKQLH